MPLTLTLDCEHETRKVVPASSSTITIDIFIFPPQRQP
jgi:hypothetical protein